MQKEKNDLPLSEHLVTTELGVWRAYHSTVQNKK